MYACCGATDYYLETGDPAYWKTLNVLWNDLTAHQLYVNGGVGARAAGEALGDPYELPNAQAYGESCAAIGNMMWNWRMLAASGDAKLRTLSNGRSTTASTRECRLMARRIATATRLRLIQRGSREIAIWSKEKFEMRGMTQRAVRPTWRGHLRHCRDTSTAPAPTGFTSICTITLR
jgi:hypothetical protein